MQVFQINPVRAWGAVATTVVSVALSIYLISISPTYLLPLAWAFAGTAWTGVSPVTTATCIHRGNVAKAAGQRMLHTM